MIGFFEAGLDVGEHEVVEESLDFGRMFMSGRPQTDVGERPWLFFKPVLNERVKGRTAFGLGRKFKNGAFTGVPLVWLRLGFEGLLQK